MSTTSVRLDTGGRLMKKLIVGGLAALAIGLGMAPVAQAGRRLHNLAEERHVFHHLPLLRSMETRHNNHLLRQQWSLHHYRRISPCSSSSRASSR